MDMRTATAEAAVWIDHANKVAAQPGYGRLEAVLKAIELVQLAEHNALLREQNALLSALTDVLRPDK